MSSPHHTAPCGTHFRFLPLTGRQEADIAAASGDTAARALGLLSALLAGAWRKGEPVTLQDLTLAEYDVALSGLYQYLYQPTVLCEARCRDCEEPFEFSLNLPDLQSAAWANTSNFEGQHWDSLSTPSGRVIRLPRVKDLSTLQHATAQEWAKACVIEGDTNFEAVQADLAQAGPLLSKDIKTTCPECEAANTVRFDVARYLVESIEGETAFLWREVHLIAKTYHWALADILDLPRSARRDMAALIVAERPRVRAAS
ncbi:hypothetical protein [Shimia sp. Alg240-R146]|uniref:hypothetical protein n=1 Tax=Shimia sp. Alg240-R146 TaxID=2993449 RepID=UPI0022E5E266|nr:hypothetical protein [Shimia sp. Alg240-R146]